MNNLLIFESDASVYLGEISKRDLGNIQIVAAVDDQQAQKYASWANIILGQPALIASILKETDQLQWVQSTFAGVEPLCKPGLPQNYLLTGVKDIFGPLMSEYVFGYILSRERSILATDRNQQNRVWQRIKYRSLANITIGIVGLGSIGRAIARTAAHFNMRVLGMKRTSGEVDFVDQLYLPSELDIFLPQLDYLVLILPDTSESRNFITRKELNMMNKSSILINVGRGVTVNQSDLIAALESKTIGGAILDVFEEEPLLPDNPLWGMKNVVVTPHNSAYSFPEQVVDIFCENYQRFVDGLPLRYAVDFNRGY
ncbi:MAG: D-2-hydroxyacid dehydrogenase [Desulfofustis sp.]|jgi:phosphoglycerate dehydrogenase-like enzyme